MKAKYFQDTDTLHLELRDSMVVEARDLDEVTILDYDEKGRLVGITLERAKDRVVGARIRLKTIDA